MIKKIILGGLVLFCIYGALNYSGFCFKKMRYLSDEEKIRMAVAVVNKMGREFVGDRSSSISSLRYVDVVPYASVNAFLRENHNCCKVVPYAGYKRVTGVPWPPTFFERIIGRYNSAVRIKYTIRYIEGILDKNKKKGPGKLYEELVIGDYHINNCGEATKHTMLSDIATFYTIKCQ